MGYTGFTPCTEHLVDHRGLFSKICWMETPPAIFPYMMSALPVKLTDIQKQWWSIVSTWSHHRWSADVEDYIHIRKSIKTCRHHPNADCGICGSGFCSFPASSKNEELMCLFCPFDDVVKSAMKANGRTDRQIRAAIRARAGLTR
jgi:hypothetical protein